MPPEPLHVCGVCGRVLNDRVFYRPDGSDGHEYVHNMQDEPADHEPQPIPYEQAVEQGLVKIRCDFCNRNVGATEEIWTVPCGDFHVMLQHFSRGDWAACGECARFIRDDDWEGLLERVMETYIQNHPEAKFLPPKDFVRGFYGKVQAHQTGPIWRER